MLSDWLIPLPPNATAPAARGNTKRAIGIYPCINGGHCDQFVLVKLDNRGCPYGTCSPEEVTVKGCRKRAVKGAPEDIPPQTYEAYLAALERVQELKGVPESYVRYLDAAWERYNREEATDASDSA
ncbi:hypothetical protein [Kordiimonas sp.]|uniref:hypothetical protein n=1 Tax=Kordiimonas sp. TaxID=1970157 RepID=UPI003A92BF4D